MIIFNFKSFIIKVLFSYVLKELCNLFKNLYVLIPYYIFAYLLIIKFRVSKDLHLNASRLAPFLTKQNHLALGFCF